MQQLCEEAARLRQRCDRLHRRLHSSVHDLHRALADYVKLVWATDARREGVRNARLDLHRTLLLSRDDRDAFSRREPKEPSSDDPVP